MAARIRDLAALHARRLAHAGLGDRAAGRAVADCRGICGRCRTSATGRQPGDAVALQAPVIVARSNTRRRSTRRSAIATCRSSTACGPTCCRRSTSSVDCGIAFWRRRSDALPSSRWSCPATTRRPVSIPTPSSASSTTHPGVRLVMVDDGSVDGTCGRARADAARPRRRRSTTIRLPANGGKGEAVRTGLVAAIAGNPAVVGFFDADLSTPLAAIDDFLARAARASGGRVRPRLARPVAGPRRQTQDLAALSGPGLGDGDLACARSSRLRHPVRRQDAARSTPPRARSLPQPFRSRWIFDVELIARYLRLPVGPGEPARRDRLYELVLPAWHDRPGSKLRWYDFRARDGRSRIHLARTHWPPGEQTMSNEKKPPDRRVPSTVHGYGCRGCGQSRSCRVTSWAPGSRRRATRSTSRSSATRTGWAATT